MVLKPLVLTKLLGSSVLVSCIIALSPAAEAGNYTACKRLGDFTNGKSCVCIAANRHKKKQEIGGGMLENCAGVRVANFNVPSVTNSPPGNGDDGDNGTSGLGNPGNAKPVGHAGEGPPGGTQDAKMNAPPGGPGTRGASDG
jgi:hypothetical protein